MEQLYQTSRLLVKSVDTLFVRYLYDRIKWNGRMLGIVGPRGVGKTTMLLQHIKMCLPIERTLYASADNLYFVDHSLVELASAFKFNTVLAAGVTGVVKSIEHISSCASADNIKSTNEESKKLTTQAKNDAENSVNELKSELDEHSISKDDGFDLADVVFFLERFFFVYGVVLKCQNKPLEKIVHRFSFLIKECGDDDLENVIDELKIEFEYDEENDYDNRSNRGFFFKYPMNENLMRNILNSFPCFA